MSSFSDQYDALHRSTELAARVARAKLACGVCGESDERPLFWWLDMTDMERVKAHAECGDEAGLDEGSEAVDE